MDLGFPGGASGKERACQGKRCKSFGFNPQVRKIPWRRAWRGNPPEYSCLENPMDRGAWQAMVHWVAKRGTRLKRLSTHVCQSGTHLTMSLQEEETRTHMHTEGRPRGDMGRRQPGTRLQEKPVQPTTRSWTCSLRNCEKINCLTHLACGIFFWQP